MSDISRRTLMKASAATTLAMLLPHRLAHAETTASKGTLRIATFGGSWRDALDKFIVPPVREQGAAIEYVIGNPEGNLAKLIAAKRQNQLPFDVMDSSPLFYQEAVDAGFVKAIDYESLSNGNEIPEWARDKYQITVLWSPEGIVYNEAKLKEAGVEPPKSYSDLAKPEFAGRVAFPDPSHVQHWGAVVALAREAGGNEAEMSAVIPIVNKIKPAYFFTSSTDLATRFGSGEIWLAPWHGGYALRLRRAGVPTGMVYPTVGGNKGSLWPGTRLIMEGTDVEKPALSYFNSYLSAEGGYGFCDATGSVPVNAEARRMMLKQEDAKQLLLLSDDDLKNAYRVDWTKLDQKAWREAWNNDLLR